MQRQILQLAVFNLDRAHTRHKAAGVSEFTVILEHEKVGLLVKIAEIAQHGDRGQHYRRQHEYNDHDRCVPHRVIRAAGH